MGFSNQERINKTHKALSANVIDAAEGSAWYESRIFFELVSDSNKVWTQLNVLKQNPAVNLAEARTNVSGSLGGIVEDKSQFGDAIRLTEVAGTNFSTFRALKSYNDPSSGVFDNWVQPQQIPRTGSNNAPSAGYSIRLWDGDPNTTGSEVSTTDGTSGTGENKSVGWVFNYAIGMLMMSADFRTTLTHNDIYITGFRYIGTTVSDLTASLSDISGESFIVLSSSTNLTNERVLTADKGVKIVDNGSNVEIQQNMVWREIPSGSIDGSNVTFTLAQTPNPPESLWIFKNGLAMASGSGCDYVLSGTNTIIFNAESTPRSGSNLFVKYAI